MLTDWAYLAETKNKYAIFSRLVLCAENTLHFKKSTPDKYTIIFASIIDSDKPRHPPHNLISLRCTL